MQDGKADAIFLSCLSVDLGPRPLLTLYPVHFPDIGARLPIPIQPSRGTPSTLSQMGELQTERSSNLLGTSGIQGHISHDLISVFL